MLSAPERDPGRCRRVPICGTLWRSLDLRATVGVPVSGILTVSGTLPRAGKVVSRTGGELADVAGLPQVAELGGELSDAEDGAPVLAARLDALQHALVDEAFDHRVALADASDVAM